MWEDSTASPDIFRLQFSLRPGMPLYRVIGSVVGSFIAKSLSRNGNTTLHYDEALASAGEVTGYQRASWVEDPR